jgi:hypothetical protein
MLNPGTSLAEANRLGSIAEALIREVPEVTQVGGARDEPSWTSTPRACTPPRSTWTCSAAAATARP